MKRVKEYILNFINGFCMALADSVPGVSGGTIAFLLGFYDRFISSLDDLFRGSFEKKKDALKFLIKIGIGWVIGFGLSATVLSNLFETKIYAMSSLFIGFILAAIPMVVKEEKESLKKNYKNVIFMLLGILLVVGISLLTTKGGIDVDLNHLNLFTGIYLFLAASVAITAMVLPGISGSTLLLIFGLYVPVMGAVKSFLHLDFSVLPILIIFGLGIVAGIVFFVKLIRKGLEHHRGAMVYAILGMMIGSFYSIMCGPTTLDIPQEMLSSHNFDIVFFLLGIVIIGLLELLKRVLEKRSE